MVICWVHPKKVNQRTDTILPAAFSPEKLKQLNTRSAPSVVLKRLLDKQDKKERAKQRACSFCRVRIKPNQTWQGSIPEECKCENVTTGMRAAVTSEDVLNKTKIHGTTNCVFSLTVCEHFKNPGHAVLDSNPSPHDCTEFTDSVIFEIQDELVRVFNKLHTVDDVIFSD